MTWTFKTSAMSICHYVPTKCIWSY
jgi:hypothetical protein